MLQNHHVDEDTRAFLAHVLGGEYDFDFEGDASWMISQAWEGADRGVRDALEHEYDAVKEARYSAHKAADRLAQHAFFRRAGIDPATVEWRWWHQGDDGSLFAVYEIKEED